MTVLLLAPSFEETPSFRTWGPLTVHLISLSPRRLLHPRTPGALLVPQCRPRRQTLVWHHGNQNAGGQLEERRPALHGLVLTPPGCAELEADEGWDGRDSVASVFDRVAWAVLLSRVLL